MYSISQPSEESFRSERYINYDGSNILYFELISEEYICQLAYLVDSTYELI